MLKRHPFAATAGFLFGVLVPLLGVFLGLQVSPALGNLFAFPLIAMAWALGEPIGQLSSLSRVAALLASGLLWCCVFAAVAAAGARGRP